MKIFHDAHLYMHYIHAEIHTCLHVYVNVYIA